MSVQAMAWAMEQQAVQDAPSCHVLLVLANFAGEDGRGAFPSVSTLARITKLSERTVQYKLAALEKACVIRRGNQDIAAAYISRGDRRPTVYDLDLTTGRGENDGVNGVQPTAERGAPAAPRSERGAADDTNGVQLTTERGAPAAPNPSINHQVIQKSRGASPSGSRLPLDWSPSDEDLAFARRHRPELDAQAEADKFRDHWAAQPGAAGRKADWPATWRNWIRRASAPRIAPGQPVQGSTVPAAPQRDWRAPSESPLQTAIAHACHLHSLGAVDDAERDRMIAEARARHGEEVET